MDCVCETSRVGVRCSFFMPSHDFTVLSNRGRPAAYFLPVKRGKGPVLRPALGFSKSFSANSSSGSPASRPRNTAVRKHPQPPKGGFAAACLRNFCRLSTQSPPRAYGIFLASARSWTAVRMAGEIPLVSRGRCAAVFH